MSKKIVLQTQLNCEKCKRRAMKMVAGVEGVFSIDADTENNKITVIGDADPVCLTASLRKVKSANSKEPKREKKPEPANPDKKPKNDQDSKPDISYVILPASCDHYSVYTALPYRDASHEGFR